MRVSNAELTHMTPQSTKCCEDLNNRMATRQSCGIKQMLVFAESNSAGKRPVGGIGDGH
jgi:hypothetical protein